MDIRLEPEELLLAQLIRVAIRDACHHNVAVEFFGQA